MSPRKPLVAVPRGIIHVPVTPFTSENEIDLDTFVRVIEFLLGHNASSLCINLHLAESLNLTTDERKLLAKTAVDVVGWKSAGHCACQHVGDRPSDGSCSPC
jgi:dihydrodipicolinate synthase/N-acetylneuraminate lyase